MYYRNEFEFLDTQQKAYVFGLFFADGCITTRNTVRLSLIDEQIIKDIYTIFPFFNEGSFDFGVYNKNSKRQYSISKKNVDLYTQFYKHGIYPRKSTENKEELKIPKTITDNLVHHFIRGYFDGNGSISIPTKRPNLRRVEICSSSNNFIIELKIYLESKGLNCPIYREKQNTKSILYILEWVNTKDILSIKKFLYRDSSIHLNRKKEKFDSFIPIIRGSKNPTCTKCNQYLNKNGTRVTKTGTYIRYKCKNCNTNTQKLLVPLKLDELLETP